MATTAYSSSASTGPSTTSGTGNNDQYSYQRPSTTATRAMVSDSSPTDHNSPNPPTLQRRKTNNYEEAIASRVHADEGVSNNTPVVSGLAYRGDHAQASHTDASRPSIGLLGRQQSWKTSDAKRANMERMLSSEGKSGGYSSTGHGGAQ